ncbi:RtcB family protein, partial [Escherichia coli]
EHKTLSISWSHYLFEEAPQAYKSAESVVQCLVQAGLIIPVARLRPVLTLKNSGGKKG